MILLETFEKQGPYDQRPHTWIVWLLDGRKEAQSDTSGRDVVDGSDASLVLSFLWEHR